MIMTQVERKKKLGHRIIDEREYREVNVRMLRVDWVFKERDKKPDGKT